MGRRRRVLAFAILAAVLVLSGVGTALFSGASSAPSSGGPVALGPRPVVSTAPSGGSGSGPGGMMGGYGPGPGGTGGMMSGWSAGVTTGQALTIGQAQQAFQRYLDRVDTPDLVLDDVMEFQDNFYAIVKEKSTGIGAFELLANKYTGGVIPEPGPTMVWNTKYGIMTPQQANGPMTVTADQATRIAQGWLDQQQPGSTTEAPDPFYGYSTLHILKDGKVTGMLSVNGSSGQVWYHTWHGPFVQMRKVGA